MKKLIALGLITCTGALTGCLGSSDNDKDTSENTQQDITINFAAEINGQPFACDTTFGGLGTTSSSASFTDYRIYLHGVKLIDAEGNRHDVALTNDGVWQTDEVALLDFETGDGSCTGTAETNMQIKGSVASGNYVGLEFGVGVPGQLNHQDSAVAASPLNISGMFWRWQSGYKHARIDVALETPYTYTDGEGVEQVSNQWFFHLGSTDCSGDPTTGEEVTCGNPNRPTITLADFDIEANKVTVDYGRLMSGSDLSTSTPLPFGCMSGVMDPDCTGPFANIGLTDSAQTFFGKGTL